VRATVEGILTEIKTHGDAAVRDLSEKFDKWSPASFRLSPAEIEKAIGQVAKRDLEDIKFRAGAGARLRAEAARHHEGPRGRDGCPASCSGTAIIPVNSIGCYVPGGRYPMVASAHMFDRHREGRGREAHHRLRAAVPWRAASGDRRRDAFRRRGRDLCTWRRAGGWPAMALGTGTIGAVDMIVGRATPMWRRRSASCSAVSASTCSPARPKR